MKRNLSKIKDKSSKRLVKKYDGKDCQQVKSNSPGAPVTSTDTDDRPFNKRSDKQQIYITNIDPTKNTWEKTRGGSLPGKSTTTYEAFTSSTSESDRDRKPNSGRSCQRGDLASRIANKYRDSGHEVCITVPEGGKGNVRIVGNVSTPNQSAFKQVEFSSQDAVYGTPIEASSDEETDNVHANKNNSELRSAGYKNYIVIPMSSTHGGLPHRQGKAEDSSSPQQVTTQDNHRPRRNQSFESEQAEQFRVQPSLAMPLISVNIQTSQEQVSHDLPKNKNNSSIQNPSSRLFRLKQHLFENGVVCSTENNPGYKTKRDAIGNMENANGHKDASMEAENLRGALLKQLISNSQQEAHNNRLNKTGSNTTYSSIALENNQSRNKLNEILRSDNSGLTRPVIYLATLDDNALFGNGQQRSTDKDVDKNKENILQTTTKSFPKTVSLTKNPSNKSSRRKSEINGSKIGVRKSKPSLKSSIPKPSLVCSKRKSSMLLGKLSRSIEGSSSRSSKKYVIRDIMVIPEDNVCKEFANAYPAQPLNLEIPEETVMFTEREIRLHDLNNGSTFETNAEPLTPLKRQADSTKMKYTNSHRNSPIILKNNNDGGSIPCLYHCSTSTIETVGGIKNNFTVNSMTAHHIGQNNPDDNKLKTILIDSETHKEIMNAIDSSSGKNHIISLPTKRSWKDSAGKRQSIEMKSKEGITLKKGLSFIETITEEDTQDESRKNLQNRNSKPIQVFSTHVKNVTENTETDRSQLFEIGRKTDFKTPEQPGRNKANHIASSFFTYPAKVFDNTPLKYNDRNFENNQQSSYFGKKPKRAKNQNKKQDSKVLSTILSFIEPIQDPKSNVYALTEVHSNLYEKETAGRKNKRSSKTPKFSKPTPDTMVYVGRLPNTTYNVFFSPDAPKQHGDDAKSVQSETKKVTKIKSEKLLAEGPKAILIFVNKKTELNRNPFDGNVLYDDDNDEISKRDRKGKNKDHRKRGKGKRRSDDLKSTKSGKSGKSAHSDFNVSSLRDPGRSGDSGVVVERSPSGLKTVVKYPCGCMKITKVDPVNETVSEEVTSAFCRLGSKCEISQGQKNKRLLQYSADNYDSRREGAGLPRSPQLDVVIEGLMSKKPIQPQEPAQQMKGTNLTGTLTIKTNRCNGVFNFYIDPRIKQYLSNNLACITKNRDFQSTSYRQSSY